LNISGEITVAALREAVFKALNDPPFFASCIEGVRDLKAIDATHYSAVLETRIAYLRFKFKANVEITRLSPPEEIEAKVEGTPFGIVGRLTATAKTRLPDRPLGPVECHFSLAAQSQGARLYASHMACSQRDTCSGASSSRS
jgi:carbon monoxide dehydrogenase subunit G